MPVFPFRPIGPRFVLAVLVFLLPACRAGAEELVRLQETFQAGYQYRVSTRVEVSGKLTLPPTKGKEPAPLTVNGTSAIDYDERVLAAAGGTVEKTVRFYRRMDFGRKVGEQTQKTSLRPEVRRLILLRNKNAEVPFCPEGPLRWDEIDLVRTDVFTPALAGFLPEKPVAAGDRWMAAAAAVQELTDLEGIDGQVECRLEGTATLEKRRHARVGLSGTVRGTGEDGPARHQLDGYFYFDLESNHLSYLSIRGVQTMLDKDGKEVGRVEGQFVLTRQAHTSAPELSDAALRGLTLEPTSDNTLLLYDNAALGARFLYPRRWRVAGGLGRQVRLDGSDGSGLLITLEPPGKVPAAAQFLAESRDYFQAQKARIVRFMAPRTVQAAPRELHRFTIDVELNGEKLLMDYYVARQANGGATLAARLPAADRDTLEKEVLRIARSLTITRPIK